MAGEVPDFGSELRRLRVEAGLSQAQLAALVHCDKSHVSHVEHGRRTATPEFARLCDQALGAGGVLLRITGSSRCPYPGLASFTDTEALWFHGRQRACAELLRMLDDRVRHGGGPLAVVGPSGAGKSSLLQAGLLPALARGDLPGCSGRAVVFTPTAEPMAQLSAARDEGSAGPGAGPAVWVVDQFEELFTLCPDEQQRRAFLDALCDESGDAGTDPGTRRVVIVCVRADFYGHCLAHDGLLAAVRRGQFALGPMTAAEVSEAITAPARAVRLDFEPGLVDLLLHDLGLDSGGPDVSCDPGLLPLLAHTLRALWQQRSERVLTVAGYRAAGGVIGSVSTTAENAWTSLDETTGDLARQLLLSLVTVADDAEPTRRRVSRDDLLAAVADSAAAVRVLEDFSRARLVSVEHDGVALAHEAVIRAWPRLREWIAQDRAGLLIKQRLEQDAGVWEVHDHDPAHLYRDTRLAITRNWVAGNSRRLGLSPAAAAFLAAAEAARRAEQHTERVRRRRLRLLITGGSLLLVLVLVAGPLLAVQYRLAQQAIRKNTAADLMTQYDSGTGSGLGLLLAASAYGQDHTNQRAISALLSATGAPFAGTMSGPRNRQWNLAVDPDSGLIASAGVDGQVGLFQPVQRRWLAPLGPGTVGAPAAIMPSLVSAAFDGVAQGAPGPITFAPHGHLLAVSTGQRIDEWDLSDPAAPLWIRAVTDQAAGANALTFSHDAAVLAAAGNDGFVREWDPVSGRLHPAPRPTGGPALGVAYSPDGRWLAAGSRDHTVRVWARDDPATGPLTLNAPSGHSDNVIHVTFSPDSTMLVSTSDDGTAKIWDTRFAPDQLPQNLPSLGPVFDAAFSPDGAILATASYDRSVRLWDPRSGHLIQELAGPADRVMGVVFSPDGHLLTSLAFNGDVTSWNLTGPVRYTLPATAVHGMDINSDGSLLATGDSNGLLQIWRRRPDARDSRDLQLLLQRSLPSSAGAVFRIVFSPDNRTLAVITDAPQPWLLDTTTGTLSPLGGNDDIQWARSIAFAGPDHVHSINNHGDIRTWNIHDPEHPAVVAQPGTRALAADPSGRFYIRPADTRPDKLVVNDLSGHLLGSSPLPGIPSYVDVGLVMTLNPDSTMLAVGLTDQTVGVYRIENLPDHHVTLQFLHSLLRGSSSGNQLEVLAFSPDGRILAGAGDDHTIQLWDTRTWQPTATLTGHTGNIYSLAFSPDSTTLVSSSEDSSLRFWNLNPGDAFHHACQHATHLDENNWHQQITGPYVPAC